MLSPAIQDALNAQLQKEVYSSHLYLAMAAYCDAQNLPGFARWLRVQSDEERSHALKIYDFINDRDGRVLLQGVDRPPADFGSPLQLFEQVLAHEREISASINQLYFLAVQEKDPASHTFLEWFVEEQVEEEKAATRIVETLRLVAADRTGLLLLDRELGERRAAG